MLEQVAQELRRWLVALPEKPEVVFQLPGADSAVRPKISLYLFEIQQKPTAQTGARAVREYCLRYLVTASATDPLVAQRVLGGALFAATERSDVEVERDPPSLELWRALGVRPQPAFLLSVPWRKENPPQIVPSWSTEPTELEMRRLRRLVGQVLSGSGAPLVFATVELPALGRSTVTDDAGRFDLSVVPRGADMMIRVTAHGRVTERRVNDTVDSKGELLIRVVSEQCIGGAR